MSDLAKKAREYADRMENGPYVHLKDTRDLLRSLADEVEEKEKARYAFSMALHEQTERTGIMRNALNEAKKAIEHLDDGVLGYHQVDNIYTCEPEYEYPVKHELLEEINRALGETNEPQT